MIHPGDPLLGYLRKRLTARPTDDEMEGMEGRRGHRVQDPRTLFVVGHVRGPGPLFSFVGSSRFLVGPAVPCRSPFSLVGSGSDLAKSGLYQIVNRDADVPRCSSVGCTRVVVESIWGRLMSLSLFTVDLKLLRIYPPRGRSAIQAQGAYLSNSYPKYLA